MKQLRDIPGSVGFSWPVEIGKDASPLIAKINEELVPHAQGFLSMTIEDRDTAIIDIRGKVCDRHPYWKDDPRKVGATKCPESHEGLRMCGVAWIAFEPDSIDYEEEPLFDFDGRLSPAKPRIYYELARMKIDLDREGE